MKELEKKSGYIPTADGALLYYYEMGQGTPLVLVHGVLCSSQFWKYNVEELAKEYRVIGYDLRAHGYSTKVAEGNNIPKYGDDLHALIEALKLEDAALVGWSIGGQVVLDYYHKYGQAGKISKLCLVDAPVAPMGDYAWNAHVMRDHNYEKLAQLLQNMSKNTDIYLQSFVERQLHSKEILEANKGWMKEEVSKIPIWAGVSIFSDFVSRDYVFALKDVNVPTLVFGTNSQTYATGIQMAQKVAEMLPDAVFATIADTGHAMFIDKPSEFNRILLNFLQS